MTDAQKPRKLIFHIGHHKTGTTTIQNAFARKQVSLDGGRILYPARTSHNYLPGLFEAYVNDGTVLPGSPGRPGLGKIAERMASESFDYVVISGEQFEGTPPRDVKKVLTDLWLPHVTDHSVVCYLRPHAGRILSSFAEHVKLGLASGTVEDFYHKTLLTQRFFFLPRLSEWADEFGPHFKLRPMIRAELAGGSLLQDFVETGFGADARVRFETRSSANESLCLEDLLVLKLAQDALRSRDRKLRSVMGWEMAPAFAATLRDGGPGTRLMLHKSLAEQIRTTYQDDAKHLEARFFGGRPILQQELDRAVDEAVPVAQSFDPADYFNADALRGLKLLADQINRLLDFEGGSWNDFLMERRFRIFLGEDQGAPIPAKPKANRPKARGQAGRKTADRPAKQGARRKRAGKGRGLSD